MKHLLVFVSLSLLLAPAALAQAPPTPASKPAAELSPNDAWYRMTWQKQAVGFVHEIWTEDSANNKPVWHVVVEGQFSAKPDTLRELPFADFSVDMTIDKQTYGLQHASYELSFPVQPVAGPTSSDYKLVEGEVQFTADRQVENGRTLLYFHTNVEGFDDVRLNFDPGQEYIVPDAIPRILALQPRPWKGLDRAVVLLHPGLSSDRNPAKYIGQASATVRDRIEKMKIGEETLAVTPVLVTTRAKDELAMTEVLLFDDKGVVRRRWTSPVSAAEIKVDADTDPMDALVATRVGSEAEAREGITFVFAQKHRRDPFVDPRTKKKGPGTAIAGGVEPTQGPKEVVLTRPETLAMVEQADAALADLKRVLNLGESAPPEQKNKIPTLVLNINDWNTKVSKTPFPDLKARMTAINSEAVALTGSKLVPQVSQAKALYKNVDDAFKNESDQFTWSQRVQEITQLTDKIRGLLATQPPLPKAAQEEINQSLTQAQELLKRAQKREHFWQSPPVITGRVLNWEREDSPFRMGLVLFDRPFLVDTQLPLERSRSMVVLAPKEGKAGENKTYMEGDPVADLLYVGRVDRNGVWFKYDGEDIWVPSGGR